MACSRNNGNQRNALESSTEGCNRDSVDSEGHAFKASLMMLSCRMHLDMTGNGTWVCLKMRGAGNGSFASGVCFVVCFGGLFRQSRTSQPYLKLVTPKKIQTHMTAALQNQHIVEEQLLYKINILLKNSCSTKSRYC